MPTEADTTLDGQAVRRMLGLPSNADDQKANAMMAALVKRYTGRSSRPARELDGGLVRQVMGVHEDAPADWINAQVWDWLAETGSSSFANGLRDKFGVDPATWKNCQRAAA